MPFTGVISFLLPLSLSWFVPFSLICLLPRVPCFDIPFGFFSSPPSISHLFLKNSKSDMTQTCFKGYSLFSTKSSPFHMLLNCLSSFIYHHDRHQPPHWINNALPRLWFSCCFFFLECFLSLFLMVKTSHKQQSPSFQICRNPPIILCTCLR